MLAHGLREPSRTWDTLHAAGGIGRPVEVPQGLDEGVVVRAARRRAHRREAPTYSPRSFSTRLLMPLVVRYTFRRTTRLP